MKKRHSESLKEMGYQGSVETFRETVTAVKREMFPDWSDEDLIYTRDQAQDFVNEVKKRLGASKLTRVFVLKSLVSIRKQRKRPKPRIDPPSE